MPIREIEEKCCYCKEHKALEIIKKKQVVIPRLLCWRGLSDYNYPLLPKYWLEQEEYDLLREVFYEIH